MVAEYLKKAKEVDPADPPYVLHVVKEYCLDETLSVEQRLFAIGYLINRNKEDYLSSLRTKTINQKKFIDVLQKEIKTLKEGTQKKKVVVVRKKSV